MRLILSRRAALSAMSVVALDPAQAAPAAVPSRIVALEWSIASMLLALGVVPVAIGETEGYRTWVRVPELPGGVADVGVRTEPNLEALAGLRPDLILASPLSRSIEPLIAAIAPVREVAIYTEARDPVGSSERELRALGAALGRPDGAADVIARCAAIFAETRERLASQADVPLVCVSFLDARHVRVFGPGSIFDGALARLGLRNGWSRPGTLWGYDLIGIEELARLPDARIVIVDPTPPDVRLPPATPSLWGGLPAVRAGRVTRLAAVWQFGELTAAARFAGLLADALSAPGVSRAGG